MTFKFSNNARSTLAAAISDSDLTFSVQGGDGALFPASGNFRVMLLKATGVREIVEVESRSTDAFTIMTGGRGLEGTSAQTYSSGDVTSGVSVRLVATAGVFERFLQRLASTYTAIFDFGALTANRAISFPDSSGTVMMQGDATYGFTTGDVKATYKASADTGWVMSNDGSIGNASSGATTRANADTEALFTLLYNNITALVVQDSSGSTVSRGVSAAADFAANRRLVIPKALGRAMAVAGAGAGLTSRTLGAVVGHEALQQHSHGVNDPGHDHVYPQYAAVFGSGSTGYAIGAGAAVGSMSDTTGITIDDAGTGDAGNMQPTTFLNMMIKL